MIQLLSLNYYIKIFDVQTYIILYLNIYIYHYNLYYTYINYNILFLNAPTSFGAISSSIRVYGREEGTLQQLVRAFPVHRIRIDIRNTATGEEVTKHYTPLPPPQRSYSRNSTLIITGAHRLSRIIILFLLFVADIVLRRLHRTGVCNHRPTVRTYAIRLLHRLTDCHFNDVTEFRIPVRCNHAVEGLFSIPP